MPTADYALRERLADVSNASGEGNDLLTVAIAPETPVGEVLERVEEDHAEAEYIHADETSSERRAVLERARHLLHQYDATPERGLVLHVGALAGEEGVAEYVFDDLPRPVREDVFEWSSEFRVDVLADVVGPEATYGLLVVERGGAALGRLAGDHVEVVETLESDVMGKTRAGGQSAARFERDRERQKREFFGEVADEAARAFLEDGEPAVDGLLVGGTSVTVDGFRSGDHLDHRLADLVVGGTFAVEYASEQGLRQLADAAADVVDDAERADVRDALEAFRSALREDAGDDDGPAVVYGEDEVDRALTYDAVDTLLVAGDRSATEIRAYEERVAEEGGEVVVVPPDSEDGARFAEAFEVGAILRFPVE